MTLNKRDEKLQIQKRVKKKHMFSIMTQRSPVEKNLPECWLIVFLLMKDHQQKETAPEIQKTRPVQPVGLYLRLVSLLEWQFGPLL